MNFLAHAYLSFGNEELIVGNLIADMVKGKQADAFPAEIREGIMLHRQIDAYTDHHAEVRDTKHVFTHSVGRYDNSFLDVSYDHFLATSEDFRPLEGWGAYAERCYGAVEKYAEILPAKFGSMFIYMKSENWLVNYRHDWMIERSFDRLKRRAKFLSEDVSPFVDFERNYGALRDSFNRFFPDLKSFVESKPY